jgi:hypothetical protein
MATLGNRTPRNMTYRQLVDMFQEICFNRRQIEQNFSQGSIDEIDINKLDITDFPFLHISPLPVSIDTQTMTLSFEVIVADMTQLENVVDRSGSGVRGTSPEGDAYSETLNILKDIIANFRQNLQTGSYVDVSAEIQMPITAEPFRAKFANILTGWSATMNITCQNTNNLCDVPQTMNDGN